MNLFMINRVQNVHACAVPRCLQPARTCGSHSLHVQHACLLKLGTTAVVIIVLFRHHPSISSTILILIIIIIM